MGSIKAWASPSPNSNRGGADWANIDSPNATKLPNSCKAEMMASSRSLFGQPLDMQTEPCNTQDFCRKPVPAGFTAECVVKRTKPRFGGTPTYCLYTADGDKFIMAARRRKKCQTASYLISTSGNNIVKDSPSVIAKVRANTGMMRKSTQYTLFSTGENYNAKNVSAENVREELALVVLKPSEGTDYSSTMGVTVPSVSTTGNPHVVKPLSPNDESLLSLSHKEAEGIESVQARQKVEFLKAELLSKKTSHRAAFDFGGQAVEASIKNVQLLGSDDEPAMKFGKSGKDSFRLNVQFPLSPVQAFGICLAVLDSC